MCNTSVVISETAAERQGKDISTGNFTVLFLLKSHINIYIIQQHKLKELSEFIPEKNLL